MLGGIVRVSGSGLGCPDWPLCHGRLLPPLELHPVIEYSHRTAASLASLLIVATAALALIAWRERRQVLYPAVAAVLLLIVQVLLGAVTVRFELPPGIVLAHLATAMLLLGTTSVTAASALAFDPARRRPDPLAIAAALATYLLILSGSLVIASGASASCSAWPLCGNGLNLTFDHYPAIQLIHRTAAGVLGVFIVGSLLVILRRESERASIRTLVALTLAAFAFQASVGAAVVLLHLPPPLRALHLALAAAVWCGTVVLAVVTRRSSLLAAETLAPKSKAERPARDVVLDYVSLAKPRIMALLLATTLAAMLIAARGWPGSWLVGLTLLGGGLAAAGASALNCWIDRDIDVLMLRTRGRPLPAGRIAPSHALAFGIALGSASFLLLAFFVNVLAAALSLSGFLFYVIVYTLWLKRSTVQNIVIGGAAGAVPPLVGWAAVAHRIDLTALGLFAIIFLWTPPHFWSLALRVRQDYARAGVPMLPVVSGQQAAKRQIFWYTVILTLVSLALYLGGSLRELYLVGALALGLVFVGLAGLNLRDARLRWTRPLFNYSLLYLSALFAVMVVDRMIA